MKYLLALCLISFASYVFGKSPCLGCARELKGSDLQSVGEMLKNTLNRWSADGGPRYEVVKINFASTQVAAGSYLIINAEVKDKNGYTKNCNIYVWSRPWMKEVNVKIDCPGEEKVVKTFSFRD